MFSPQTQKIVVSRDVVFDETKGWNWSSTSSSQKEAGSFKIITGVFGNHGIQETKPVETEQKATVKELEGVIQEEDIDESEDA